MEKGESEGDRGRGSRGEGQFTFWCPFLREYHRELGLWRWTYFLNFPFVPWWFVRYFVILGVVLLAFHHVVASARDYQSLLNNCTCHATKLTVNCIIVCASCNCLFVMFSAMSVFRLFRNGAMSGCLSARVGSCVLGTGLRSGLGLGFPGWGFGVVSDLGLGFRLLDLRFGIWL